MEFKGIRSLPPEGELHEEFMRPASGPGGQHLNKATNAVRLSYRFAESQFIPQYAKDRLCAIGGSKVSGGTLTVLSLGDRSLTVNRRDARKRLAAMIEEVLKRPKRRRPTKPTCASKERRIKAKYVRSKVKQSRRPVNDSD